MLTTADIHQSELHYEELARAVSKHRPDVLALVGDMLNAVGSFAEPELSTPKCAQMLAALPVAHLIFIRGNHEDFNWIEFVTAWPHERRQLTALYGTACVIGPLVLIGFPCLTGFEVHWCAHLAETDNKMELFPRKARPQLSSDYETWLPNLMRKIGPPGRVLWLMHEPPMGLPLADPHLFNPLWTSAIERFSPMIVAFGHDHSTPLLNGCWHAQWANSTCLNVGQAVEKLHFLLMDFEFAQASPSVPLQISVQAFPWGQSFLIQPGDTRISAR